MTENVVIKEFVYRVISEVFTLFTCFWLRFLFTLVQCNCYQIHVAQA